MDFEKMKAVIADTLCCDAEKINMEARFTEDLGMDSLDAVQLNMAMEDEFGKSVPDDDLVGLKTVGDMYNYLSAHAA